MTISRKRSRAAIVGAITGVIALTAACTSNGGSDDGADPETPADPVDLRMTVWSANEGHHEVFNEIADAYIEENPELVSSITFDAFAFEEYINALTTQIAGGDAPDLAWVMESYASQFVTSGVFTNLDPVFSETEGYDLDDLIPGATELWSVDGDIHGYPFSNSPFGIYVNLDLIEETGQDNPRDLLESGDWTYDNMIAIAAEVADQTSGTGFMNGSSPYATWNDGLGPMWLAWGAAPWSEDGTECQFDQPEVVEFFEWYHTNAFENGAMPLPGEQFDFPSGQSAFLLAQLSASTGLGDDFEWDFLPLPAGPAGEVPVVGQGGVGVVAQGDNADIAANFLAYFSNPENSRLLAQYFPPPRTSQLTIDVLSDAAPLLTTEQLQGTVIDQSAEAVAKMGHPQMSDIADPVRIELDSLWTADADIPSVLSAVCAEIDPIISGD